MVIDFEKSVKKIHTQFIIYEISSVCKNQHLQGKHASPHIAVCNKFNIAFLEKESSLS